MTAPELLITTSGCEVMHAEHAQHSKPQQHMLTALLCRAFVQEGLQGSLPPKKVVEIGNGSWQDFITVVQIDLDKQDTCRHKYSSMTR